MIREEAIKQTTEWIDYLETLDADEYEIKSIEAFKMAIEALKAEPRGVIYSGDGYADGCMVYDLANCPACDFEYEEGDKDWGEPFCPHCGQALNWEIQEEGDEE